MQTVIVSGMRPTGRLHLGHLHGALRNWVRLQEDGRCFFFVADWHALTTDPEHTDKIAASTLDMVADWLAVGLDPRKSVIFVQSAVKEHAELHLLLSMITPTPWLARNPTVKEQARDLGLLGSEDDAEVMKLNYGLLGYPVLQSADVLLYKATGVPVGVDQAPHIELTREIARRFNSFYGKRTKVAAALDAVSGGTLSTQRAADALLDDPAESVAKGVRQAGNFTELVQDQVSMRRVAQAGNILPEPDTILTEVPKVPGTDGRKMSKSYNNAVFLSDAPQEVDGKLSRMMTDPRRVRRTDPGEPNDCPAFNLHRIYCTPDEIEYVSAGCRTAGIGCLDCKKIMIKHVIAELAPIHERRATLRADDVAAILADGNRQARAVAAATMREVRGAIGLPIE